MRDAADELNRAVVLVESHDDVLSTSAVLDAVAGGLPAEALLRHLVFVPEAEAGVVAGRCAAEEYVPAPALPSDPPPPTGLVAVALARVQPIDAHRVSRERSLLSSMAARLGGTVGGWAVLDVVDAPPGR